MRNIFFAKKNSRELLEPKTDNMKRHLCLAALAFIIAMMLQQPASARKFSVSTNLLGYLYLGTMNLDASYGLSRHWSLNAGAEFNPFTFSLAGKDSQIQSRQQSYELGVRLWPWHIYSGWWVSSRAKYQEYNFGGIFSDETEEGDAYGVGFSAGYSYMVHPHLNLEFGLGFWSGVKKYTVYDCPSCGLAMDAGTKGFIMPDELLLSLVYVF